MLVNLEGQIFFEKEACKLYITTLYIILYIYIFKKEKKLPVIASRESEQEGSASEISRSPSALGAPWKIGPECLMRPRRPLQVVCLGIYKESMGC